MVMSNTAKTRDLELLDALVHFVLSCPDPSMALFHEGIRQWGSEWREVRTASLPAAQWMTGDLSSPHPEINALLGLFQRQAARLRWEQSYRKGDHMVSDELLAGYGFAEVIGSQGPFVSERVRCGVGVWGPSIHYPAHYHQAEEVYLVMAGSAYFKLNGQAEVKKESGDVVHVRPLLPHGFRTTGECVVMLYLWQDGDLREKSTFV